VRSCRSAQRPTCWRGTGQPSAVSWLRYAAAGQRAASKVPAAAGDGDDTALPPPALNWRHALSAACYCVFHVSYAGDEFAGVRNRGVLERGSSHRDPFVQQAGCLSLGAGLDSQVAATACLPARIAAARHAQKLLPPTRSALDCRSPGPLPNPSQTSLSTSTLYGWAACLAPCAPAAKRHACASVVLALCVLMPRNLASSCSTTLPSWQRRHMSCPSEARLPSWGIRLGGPTSASGVLAAAATGVSASCSWPFTLKGPPYTLKGIVLGYETACIAQMGA
jgi:hypothetical protein